MVLSPHEKNLKCTTYGNYVVNFNSTHAFRSLIEINKLIPFIRGLKLTWVIWDFGRWKSQFKCAAIWFNSVGCKLIDHKSRQNCIQCLPNVDFATGHCLWGYGCIVKRKQWTLPINNRLMNHKPESNNTKEKKMIGSCVVGVSPFLTW